MKKTLLCSLGIVLVLSPAVAYMQTGKTKPTTATYITKEEVDIVNKTGQGPVLDRNVKIVDIGHENFAVGIVKRGKTVNGVAVTTAAPPAASGANPAPAAGRPAGASAPARQSCGRQMATLPPGGTPTGITHDSQTEAYYITAGTGTAFSDGYIVNGAFDPQTGRDVNGPTCVGMAYDVVKKVVKPGDIIIIPPNVVHGWLDIPEYVEYLSFRPSPGILTSGYVNPAIKK